MRGGRRRQLYAPHQRSQAAVVGRHSARVALAPEVHSDGGAGGLRPPIYGGPVGRTLEDGVVAEDWVDGKRRARRRRLRRRRSRRRRRRCAVRVGRAVRALAEDAARGPAAAPQTLRALAVRGHVVAAASLVLCAGSGALRFRGALDVDDAGARAVCVAGPVRRRRPVLRVSIRRGRGRCRAGGGGQRGQRQQQQAHHQAEMMVRVVSRYGSFQ